VVLEGRTFSSEEYRYGFNGKEKDSENFEGAYDFGARILDSRLGRFFAIDPQASNNCYISTYSCSNLNPILFIDLYGEDPIVGQLVVNLQGEVILSLTWNGLTATKFLQDQIFGSFIRPSPNPEIAERQFLLWSRGGLLGVVKNEGTEQMVSTTKYDRVGNGLLAGLQLAFDIYKANEEIEIAKLKKADAARMANYKQNLSTVSYYFAEANWCLKSIATAGNRGVFNEVSIDFALGLNKVDLTNYILLKESGFLDNCKNQMTFQGDTRGLTSQQYLAELEKAHNLLNDDIKLDYDSCYKLIEVNETIPWGNGTKKIFIKELLEIAKPAFDKQPECPKEPIKAQ
jgi:RHS repeat-associated protein